MTDRLTIAMHLLAGMESNANRRGTVEESARDALRFADALIAAAGETGEKPAAPPVMRRYEAVTLNEGGSGEFYGVCEVGRPRAIECSTRELADRVAAALNAAQGAPVVPVTFDGDGHAGHWERGWDAQQTEDVVELAFRLRPGEDAGETLAKMLAPVGRGS